MARELLSGRYRALSGHWIRVGAHAVDRSTASSVGGADESAAGRDRRIDDRLVAELDSFIAEHRRCGELDTGMTKTEPPRVWVTCTCGARIERRAQ